MVCLTNFVALSCNTLCSLSPTRSTQLPSVSQFIIFLVGLNPIPLPNLFIWGSKMRIVKASQMKNSLGSCTGGDSRAVFNYTMLNNPLKLCSCDAIFLGYGKHCKVMFAYKTKTNVFSAATMLLLLNLVQPSMILARHSHLVNSCSVTNLPLNLNQQIFELPCHRFPSPHPT